MLTSPHGGQGRHSKLQPLQERALAAKVALGSFRTIWDAIQWVQGRWQVGYSYDGLFKLLKRLDCRPKVPRPRSVKADVTVQAQWRTDGLFEALQQADVSPTQFVWFSDEMRFGLWGQTRKRWGLRGVKIIQPIQIEFAWRYLVLAVDVVRHKLTWAWADRMNQACLVPIFNRWSPDAVIGDGASAHRGKVMGALGFACIQLPPYSPELNPCERIFEWLRGKIEGEVYASLKHKQAVINRLLRQLNADKTRLQRLIGWQWIREAFAQLLP